MKYYGSSGVIKVLIYIWHIHDDTSIGPIKHTRVGERFFFHLVVVGAFSKNNGDIIDDLCLQIGRSHASNIARGIVILCILVSPVRIISRGRICVRGGAGF